MQTPIDLVNQDFSPIANGVYFTVIIKKTPLRNRNGVCIETISISRRDFIRGCCKVKSVSAMGKNSGNGNVEFLDYLQSRQ